MIGFVKQVTLIVSISVSLAGCATYEPIEPQDRYPGRITEKVKIVNPNLKEEIEAAETNHRISLFLFGLGGALGGAIGGAMVGASADNIVDASIPGEPYRYTIETADSRAIIILHKHSGFEVKDCVDVLVGQESGHISMAYGDNCN
ncbi:MAG: hypothetical protein KZQ93_20155 [Candidatus Thiodiazotropha sp. (ex Monitilora ramsayi)]|nr:hypothetical protein [Candidatus Thiodiazotropha sp. (ex Monitilora ramsayi)]